MFDKLNDEEVKYLLEDGTLLNLFGDKSCYYYEL